MSGTNESDQEPSGAVGNQRERSGTVRNCQKLRDLSKALGSCQELKTRYEPSGSIKSRQEPTCHELSETVRNLAAATSARPLGHQALGRHFALCRHFSLVWATHWPTP